MQGCLNVVDSLILGWGHAMTLVLSDRIVLSQQW